MTSPDETPDETPDEMPAEIPEGPFRDGKVHVLADRCATCVFRPGNLMHLPPGRLGELVKSNLEAQSALQCHSTLPGVTGAPPAVCRGFYDAYARFSPPLWLADRMRLTEFDPVPEKESPRADPH